MKRLPIAIAFLIFISLVVYGQQNYLIKGKSAGNVRLGMTVAQARKAIRGFRLKRTGDGEGIYLVAVLRGRKEVMSLYAGDKDQQKRINERAKIEQIWVWDTKFKTTQGVHPGMLIKDAEKKYGRIKQIELTQIEQREYATFSKHPQGLEFRVSGKGDYAGTYLFPSTTAAKYRAGSRITSIIVSGSESP